MPMRGRGLPSLLEGDPLVYADLDVVRRLEGPVDPACSTR